MDIYFFILINYGQADRQTLLLLKSLSRLKKSFIPLTNWNWRCVTVTSLMRLGLTSQTILPEDDRTGARRLTGSNTQAVAGLGHLGRSLPRLRQRQ